jgi:hypothetical protein
VAQGEDGRVSRDVVLTVLNHCGVKLAIDGNAVTIFDADGTPEVQILGEMVPRKMLHRLAEKHAISIAFFYHPAMCCPGTDSKQ